MTKPEFGEKIPPKPKREPRPLNAAQWVIVSFILLLISALLAPVVIWLWRLALGLT